MSALAMTGLGRAAALALVVAVLLSLGGCGRKGDPTVPPGEKNTYPRTYPRG